MIEQLGGWLWFVIDVGFVVAFAAALFYGMNRYRDRTRAEKQRADEATKRLYRQGDR